MFTIGLRSLIAPTYGLYFAPDDGGGAGSGGTGDGGDGSGGGNGGGDGGNGGGGNGGGNGPGDKTLTQEEVNRIVAEEKRKAARAKETELAEALGCTLAEAKAIIEEKRTADEAAASDAERAQKRAETAEQKAVDKEAKLAVKERDLEVKSALLSAGVREDRVDAALRLVADDVEPGLDEDDLRTDAAEAAEKAKKDYPEFFGESTTRRTPDSDTGGGGNGRRGDEPKSAMDRGRERARTEREKKTSDGGLARLTGTRA